MARKIRNPLAQALGLVLQSMRDKMGGISSSQVAERLGLAASHYRMVEAGSALIQPSRAIRIIQTFHSIQFIPLCQLLVSIQVLDSSRTSVRNMRTIIALLMNASPPLTKVLKKLDTLWNVVETSDAAKVSKAIISSGLKDEMMDFITTEPVMLAGSDINDFMSPTYEQPLSGRLYGKIGNILQGVAPFYLDAVLQLIDNLRNIAPRVTAEELARWEILHQNKFSHIIGIVRNPQIIVDVGNFEYTYLWEENFQKILVICSEGSQEQANLVHAQIADNLRKKFEAERIKYENQLKTFDEVVNKKIIIRFGGSKAADIDEILFYRNVPMNNLWAYIMVNGYVVPFIDNATLDSTGLDLYGTSLGYDETSEKLFKIRKLCSDLAIEI